MECRYEFHKTLKPLVTINDDLSQEETLNISSSEKDPFAAHGVQPEVIQKNWPRCINNSCRKKKNRLLK